MTLTETPNFTTTLREAFTPEEIAKYGTYHWRQVGQPVQVSEMTETKGPEFDYSEVVCHVWLTIGGRYEYLGVHDSEGGSPFSGADERLPLIPALQFGEVDGGGPLPAAGGAIPWQRAREE